MDNRILCRVLKRIWVSPRQSRNLETVDEEEHDLSNEHNTTTVTVDDDTSRNASSSMQESGANMESSIIEKAKAVAGKNLA